MCKQRRGFRQTRALHVWINSFAMSLTVVLAASDAVRVSRMHVPEILHETCHIDQRAVSLPSMHTRCSAEAFSYLPFSFWVSLADLLPNSP